MNTRLSTLVATCVDEKGVLDRKKLYDGLMLEPDNPVSIIVEAFLATDASLNNIVRVFSTQKKEAEDTFENAVKGIDQLLSQHRQEMSDAIVNFLQAQKTVENARAQATGQYERALTELSRVEGALAVTAAEARRASAKIRLTGLWSSAGLGLIAGFVGGLVVARYFL